MPAPKGGGIGSSESIALQNTLENLWSAQACLRSGFAKLAAPHNGRQQAAALQNGGFFSAIDFEDLTPTLQLSWQMWYVNVPSQGENAEVTVEYVLGIVGLFFAGVLGGAINSVAGGGTLVSFPALVAFGVPTIIANATNTAAVLPGSISSAFAYRRDMPRKGGLLWTLLLPSLAGGLIGAIILAITPESLFAHMVPFLILFATVLFGTRDFFARLVNIHHNGGERVSGLGKAWGFCFQFFVAAYGGYFGAGIGILMLASLSLMGLRDIHRMNAIKTVLASIINGTALVYFVLHRLVAWPLAILMASGAIIGGYLGAHFAKGIDQKVLRLFIVAIGLLVSLWLFVRQ